MINASGSYLYTFGHVAGGSGTDKWVSVGSPDVCSPKFTHLIVVCTVPTGFTLLKDFSMRNLSDSYDGKADPIVQCKWVNNGTFDVSGVYGVTEYRTKLSQSSILSTNSNLVSGFISIIDQLLQAKVDIFNPNYRDWPANGNKATADNLGRWIILSLKSPYANGRPEIDLYGFLGGHDKGKEVRLQIVEGDSNLNLNITCNKH